MSVTQKYYKFYIQVRDNVIEEFHAHHYLTPKELARERDQWMKLNRVSAVSISLAEYDQENTVLSEVFLDTIGEWLPGQNPEDKDAVTGESE